MSEALVDSSHWTVSVRSIGEVLAVRAGEAGLQMGFLGLPRSLGRAEIHGWLSELIAISSAATDPALAADGGSGVLPIPRSLHQALTGLLFLQAEVWAGPADRLPLTLVVVESGDRVALGWSGSGRVGVTRDGHPVESPWIVVRDDEGREARAVVFDAGAPMVARAAWRGTGPNGEPAEGTLEAEWAGRPSPTAMVEAAGSVEPAGALESVAADALPESLAVVAEPTAEAVAGMSDMVASASEVASEGNPDAIVAPAPEVPVESKAPGLRQRSAWRIRGWLDRLAGPMTKAKTGEPAAASPAGESPAAEEPEASLPPCDLEPIAHDVPGVPDLLPEPEAVEPEPEEATATGLPTPETPAAVAIEPVAAPTADESPDVAPGVEPAESEAVPEEKAIAETVAVEPPVEWVPSPSPASPAAGPAEAVEVVEVAEGEAAEWIAGGEAPGEDASEEAEAIEPAPALRRRVHARRLEWPAEEDRRWVLRMPGRRSWVVGLVVVGLFAVGWALGRVDLGSGMRAMASGLDAIGIGPSRYQVDVTSRPAGAWIAVDGVDQARRTPTTLSLKPGRHRIGLSLSDEGGSSHEVNGKRGERVALDVALWGGLRIDAPAGSSPLTVTVDGMPHGYVPLLLDRLSPGIHRLQFSGPGVTPWEQTVEVHVNGTAAVLAQPVISPPTGVLEVGARLSNESGSEPLNGAAVRIDGRPRGVTPLRLELPRGPHSIRVSYGGEESAVQVIDLPGGNQRYATLDLGLDVDQPRLAASLAARVSLGTPTVLSATLQRARPGDVHEMWLHVRTPEGAWRRYPLSLLQGAQGLVGAVPFPTDVFDGGGRTSWYVSALSPTGDEYFTEIQSAQAAR
jgi:hypothetical protein